MIFDEDYMTSVATPAAPADTQTKPTSRIFKRRKVAISNELERYLVSPAIAEDRDPLAWWKANASDYPDLACMARDYLAIPATSTASERVFSSAKHLISDTRIGLAEKTVRASCCLKSMAENGLWKEVPEAPVLDW